MKNEINAVLENMTTTIPSRRTTPARTVYCTAASAASRKKPILRRIRPLSSARPPPGQSATARERPRANGKPPKSGADTLTPWKN